MTARRMRVERWLRACPPTLPPSEAPSETRSVPISPQLRTTLQIATWPAEHCSNVFGQAGLCGCKVSTPSAGCKLSMHAIVKKG